MNEINRVVKDARNGSELSFNAFLKKTFIQLKKQLLSLTRSESKAQDIYIEAMQKFWERFVIQQNEPPQNPQGYIYRMCKNLWLMEKRDAWNQVVLKDSFSDHEAGSFEENDNEKNNEAMKREQALQVALNAISAKCKKLMELSMNTSVKLIDHVEPLGYDTYQALIQAKYNCKKRLIKEVFNALNATKNR